MGRVLDELKRRNVIRVAVACLVAAWLVLQVSDLVLGNIGAPDWVMQVLIPLFALGFPLVLVFSRACELTPEGLKLEKDEDRSKPVTRRSAMLCACLLMLSPAAHAHHSYAAEFDRDAPMTIEGEVVEVWFRSPHVRYYIRVTDADGTEVVWDTRGLTPVKLVRQGWMKDTIRVGDKITVYGHVGRTNKTIMSIIDVTLADGTVLTSRSVAYDIENE